MNRTVILGAIVILLAGVGYYQFVYLPGQEQAMPAEGTTEGAATEGATTEGTATTEAPAEGTATTEAPAEGTATTEAPAEGAATTEAPAEGAATTEAPAEGAAAPAAAAALDPANFNADAVITLIDESTLDDATKTTLRTAVEAARTNPALVADTVAQVRTALGL